jgi:hypothetical protein
LPADGRKRHYLEYASRLKSELECMDGLISVERLLGAVGTSRAGHYEVGTRFTRRELADGNAAMGDLADGIKRPSRTFNEMLKSGILSTLIRIGGYHGSTQKASYRTKKKVNGAW